MTSQVLEPCSSERSRPALRRGFTLIELLTVMAIMVVLAAMLLPAIWTAQNSGTITKVRAQFQMIAQALDEYRTQFSRYPMTTNLSGIPSGEHILARALIGPGNKDTVDTTTGTRADGVDGPGFRAIPGGRIYPPFLNPDQFKMRRYAGPDNAPGTADDSADLLDAFDYPIQYYPRRFAMGWKDATRQEMIPVQSLVGQLPPNPQFQLAAGLYNFDERDGVIPLIVLKKAIGDADGNNQINGTEKPRILGPYILAAPGPRGIWSDAATSENMYNTDQ